MSKRVKNRKEQRDYKHNPQEQKERAQRFHNRNNRGEWLMNRGRSSIHQARICVIAERNKIYDQMV